MTKKRMGLRRLSISLMALMSGLLIVTTLAVLPDVLTQTSALAQRVRPEGVWQVVYERVPSLPKENQYVSKETGKVEAENTLVGRFVRYHLYVAGRSPLYRFDWKLTLADYLGLGLNGAFDETSYPSRATLRTNPADGDRAAIKQLNRSQRDALVQALVDTFSPATSQSSRPAAAPSSRIPAIAPAPKP
ncbi:hypothetical protein [Stenomitos frigidus]|uniref:hypothetical protein n=1 Tax=Stenomitos frigidus TaxID=1886765 RepID=UPI0015E6FEAB|nr:hypothetical protein [Stenomitos frigidus]